MASSSASSAPKAYGRDVLPMTGFRSAHHPSPFTRNRAPICPAEMGQARAVIVADMGNENLRFML